MSKSAKCERTGNVIQIDDGFFTADPFSGGWEFICEAAPEKRAEYNIPVSDLIKSPEALCDWLAHISEKTWFDPAKFFDFFTRFREANGLYGSL